MPLGRRPIAFYSPSSAMSASSPQQTTMQRKFRSYESSNYDDEIASGPARNTRSSVSPRNTRQRNPSPRKTYDPLYPDLSDKASDLLYQSTNPKYNSNLYPNINREFPEDDDDLDEESRLINQSRPAYWVQESARPIRQSRDDSPLEDLKRSADNNMASVTPVPPKRKRKGMVHEMFGKEFDEATWNTLRIILILTAATLFAAVLVRLYYNTTRESPLKEFQRKFLQFRGNYSGALHPDTMDSLDSALENHVKNAGVNDKAKTYPTCILLAADKSSEEALNCLAGDIAKMIPAQDNVKLAENVYFVNLVFEKQKANHKNPDEEDLRSRVHHGINEGLNEGAKVIVFRNLEALVPKDTQLMELFYSYCDGESPTFPKTLWILTLATTGLPTLTTSRFSDEEHAHRLLSGSVEKYLEHLLESKPSPDSEIVRESDKRDRTRNALLTRIANYVIPVLNVGQRLDSCPIFEAS